MSFLQHPSLFGDSVTYGVQLCVDAFQCYGAAHTKSSSELILKIWPDKKNADKTKVTNNGYE